MTADTAADSATVAGVEGAGAGVTMAVAAAAAAAAAVAAELLDLDRLGPSLKAETCASFAPAPTSAVVLMDAAAFDALSFCCCCCVDGALMSAERSCTLETAAGLGACGCGCGCGCPGAVDTMARMLPLRW